MSSGDVVQADCSVRATFAFSCEVSSVIFVTSETLSFLEDIETYYRASINELPMD